jgi:site-specific DNA recombinase
LSLRCATYARYSTDKQTPASITDQLRTCDEFAQRKGWKLLEDHIYTEEAVSAAGADRLALKRLLQAALSSPRPFDVILVDDTSRLSRSLVDSVRIFEQLSFAGVRIVAVSQGIDSQNDQADVLVTVHGLVDSLYIKELARKTHRGLEGLALRGMHTGGNCYGYRSVRCQDGTRLEINEAEATVLRRIFEMVADGSSLRTIAKKLNLEGIQSPRPRARKQYCTWCPTAIHAMVRRELYIGRVIWNRSKFVKAPGSNKRLRRPRPQSEWRIVERPELRIVSDELWNRVRHRLASLRQTYGTQKRAGLLNRVASSPYLFSGLLKCGVCGANLVITAGRSRRGNPKYGCTQHFNRGACPNDLQESQEWLEKRLLAELQNAVLQPEAVAYAVDEFGRQLKAANANSTNELVRSRERKEHLEGELRRLAAAVAEGGHSTFLLQAITERELDLQEVNSRLPVAQPSADVQVESIRRFATERLTNLWGLLHSDVARARAELMQHIQEIRLIPQGAEGERYYIATGEWSLLNSHPEEDRARHLSGVRARLVAGARFERATFGL